MNTSDFFKKGELDMITAAIGDAEKITGSELVLQVSDKSDNYNEVYWKSGAFFTIMFLFTAAVLRILKIDVSVLYSCYFLLGAAAFSFPLGALAAICIAPWRRALIGRECMDYYTGLKAHQAFLHEEVFNTRRRTGILIYLSLFERSAVIIGDSGINSKVRQGQWDQVISGITGGLKSGRKAEAIAESVRMCGVLLRDAGIKKEDDDTDELSNEVRIGGRI